MNANYCEQIGIHAVGVYPFHCPGRLHRGQTVEKPAVRFEALATGASSALAKGECEDGVRCVLWKRREPRGVQPRVAGFGLPSLTSVL